MNNLTFRKFSQVNWARCIHPDGFNDIPEPLYLLTCLTEELGEIAKILKKLQRGFNKREQKKAKKAFIKECTPENAPLEDEIDIDMLKHWWEKKLRAKLAPEVADLFTYLDLFATRHNINLPTAVANKFNEVSREMECTYFQVPIDSSESLDQEMDLSRFPEDRNNLSRTDALINDNFKNKPE